MLINGLFKDHYNKSEAQINTPVAMLQINNFGDKEISIKGDFEEVSGNNTGMWDEIKIKILRYPTSYFIHCDLIDRNFNFFNNKKSDLLAKIDVRGKV